VTVIGERYIDADLERRFVDSLLGNPLVGNAFRGTLVEAILSQVLEPDWRWCADGWGSYDFERADGLGLEVKQSAARQNWHKEGDRPNPGRFDIAARSGRYEDDGSWSEKRGRFATIYVFGWHPLTDLAKADHRDPSQWQFFPILADRLPSLKTIALSGIRALAEPRTIDEIAAEVRRLLQP